MKRSFLLLPLLAAACAPAWTGVAPASPAPSDAPATAGGIAPCDFLLRNDTHYPLEVGVFAGTSRISLGTLSPAQSVPYAVPCSQGVVQVSARTVVRTKIERGNSWFHVRGQLVEGKTVQIALRP